ncbi:MAG: Na+/H+ antiporter NhaA [Sphingomonadaceae bacterium]
MADVLTPPFSNHTDIVLYSGSGHHVVWFVDYSNRITRKIRDVLQRTLQRYSSFDIALAVRFYPEPDQGDAGVIAAKAAIAAEQQGKFAVMHHALFKADPHFTRESVIEIAREAGLDTDRFEQDLDSKETSNHLSANIESATQSFAHPHSPMLFIDGQYYSGAWDDESIIEAIEKPLGVQIQLASSRFFSWAASSGLVLVVATFAALVWVNSGHEEQYEQLRQLLAGVRFGSWSFELPLEIWVNDGLMALFFLIVGIEIKRELHDGELSSPDKAALPLVAAVGGMLVPAGLYALINMGEPTAHGWGVPMATDIAFTLGILALLGSQVPTALKVFVSALAIADDLGAIVVIALFYGHGFDSAAFFMALGVFGVMMLLNFGKIYARWPYMLLGVVLWYFTYQSGLHATLAGVLTAIAIPSRPSAEIQGVALQAGKIFENEIRYDSSAARGFSVLQLQKIIDRLRDPGFHLQHTLENWSSYLILPLFAFFNTGIMLGGSEFRLSSPEVLGVMLGLVIGKPLGICLFSWFAIRMGWARLSSEITIRHMIGAGALCGIGFTMSIFIASSAFEGDVLQAVKLSVLAASVIAAAAGTAILLTAPRSEQADTVS